MSEDERRDLNANLCRRLEPGKPIVLKWAYTDPWGRISPVPTNILLGERDRAPSGVTAFQRQQAWFDTARNPIPDYTSEAGFWRLLDIMSKRGWGWTFTELLNGWEAHIGQEAPNTSCEGVAATLPEAAARAALAALGSGE